MIYSRTDTSCPVRTVAEQVMPLELNGTEPGPRRVLGLLPSPLGAAERRCEAAGPAPGMGGAFASISPLWLYWTIYLLEVNSR